MAKISYEEAQSSSNNSNTGVGFFSLADDGDEAVVRILHDSTDSFDIVTIHDIQTGDKRRKIVFVLLEIRWISVPSVMQV